MRQSQLPSALLLCLSVCTWLFISIPGSVLAQLDTHESETEGAGGGASEKSYARRPMLGDRFSEATFELASVHRKIATTPVIRLDCNLSDPNSLWAWVKDGLVVGTEPSLSFRFNETDPFSVYYCVLQQDGTSGGSWVAQQFVITDGLQVIERPLIGRFNGSHLVVNISSSEKVKPVVTDVACANTAIVNNGVLTNQSREMQVAFYTNRFWSMFTGPIAITPDMRQLLFYVTCTVEQAYGQDQRLSSQFTEIISGDDEGSQVARGFGLVPIIIVTSVCLLFLLLLAVLIRWAIARRSRTQN